AYDETLPAKDRVGGMQYTSLGDRSDAWSRRTHGLGKKTKNRDNTSECKGQQLPPTQPVPTYADTNSSAVATVGDTADPAERLGSEEVAAEPHVRAVSGACDVELPAAIIPALPVEQPEEVAGTANESVTAATSVATDEASSEGLPADNHTPAAGDPTSD